MVNQVILEGQLAADPVFDCDDLGRERACFKVITREHWAGLTGLLTKERHMVTVTGSFVDYARMNLRRGYFVRVEGGLQNTMWPARGGGQRNSTQIVVSDHVGSVRLDPNKEQAQELGIRAFGRRHRGEQRPENKVEEISIERLERALVYVAYVMTIHGPACAPILDRLEKEIELRRKQQDVVERAKKILEAHSIEPEPDGIKRFLSGS